MAILLATKENLGWCPAPAKWTRLLSSKGPEALIPNPPVTLVADGNSWSSGSQPYLAQGKLMWFYATPSFRVTVASSFSLRRVGRSDHEACQFHYTHAANTPEKNRSSSYINSQICDGTKPLLIYRKWRGQVWLTSRSTAIARCMDISLIKLWSWSSRSTNS